MLTTNRGPKSRESFIREGRNIALGIEETDQFVNWPADIFATLFGAIHDASEKAGAKVFY